MSVHIRRFQSADQPRCRQIILEGLGEHFGFIDESRNPDLDNIEAYYVATGNDFYVAEQDDRIVGTVGLLLEAGRARMVRMSVAKSYRNQGIAAALLKQCIATAIEHGLRQIIAFTEPHW